MHLWKEYAIIQTNFKSGASEENKGQGSHLESGRLVQARGKTGWSIFQAAGEEPEAGTLYRTDKRPDGLSGNLGGNAEFFVPYIGVKNSFFVLKEDKND